jgi:tetratricopeptide (TPR) repeat protein
MRFRPNRNRRNRPFRRLVGSLLGPNRQLANDARAMLDDANRLFDAGQYAEAADSLSQLAGMAQTNDLPRRAIQLHIRAAEAYLKSGQAARAVEHGRAALAMLAQAGQHRRALKLAPQFVGELRAAGFTAEAAAFEKEINERLAGLGLTLTPTLVAPQPSPLRNLATHCSQCSAQLRWTDDADEVECEYCGTIARAE